MKSKWLAIGLVIVEGMVVAPVFAADGTITISGVIEGSTCSISGGTGAFPGSAADFPVQLGKVQTSALNAAGKTAGTKPFFIYVGGGGAAPCTATPVAVHFEGFSPGVSPATGNLINSASPGASNVEVQLIDATANAVIDLRTGASSTFIALDATSGVATLPFAARYVATGVATEGAVRAEVQYSVTFP